MANNRLYIRCKVCKETLFLGKSYMSGFFWDAYGGDPLDKRLNEFYDKHTYCSADSCDGAFDLVYEDAREEHCKGCKGCDGKLTEKN